MTRILVSAVLVVLLLGSLGFSRPLSAAAEDSTPTAGDTEAVAGRFVEAMNAVFASGDGNALDEVVAADYVNHTPSPTREGGTATPDLAGLKDSFVAVHDVFPDATVTIDEAIVEGDLAALLVTFDGLMGPDSETQGVIVVRVADGKVVESWNFESGGTARMQPMFEATPTA